ncbi:MAG: hypothetical protein A3H42_06315 [Deltaproteobacteria bacterium RIFCSPLOWO2_02_FULL_46_8]|nr:MAG: hypothetical protein A3H42_06315 [Deltaproteobacteria bacterium RIFCSPLOWO2_02_FULL_46_8]
MKGIFLSFGAFCFLIPVSIVAVRSYAGKKYFRPLIGAFVIAAFFYAFLFYCLPSDLGFLTKGWMVADQRLDFINGFLLLFLLFHSYWDAVYTSFFTGFSTKILIQMLRKEGHSLNVEELIKMYQGSQSGNPVIDGRLQNLVRGSYLAPGISGEYQLLPKGNFFAVFTRTFQKILHIGEGG